MYEIEIKAHLDDPAYIEAQIKQLGANFRKLIQQDDTYFQHPIRNFAQTDEALRIRRSDKNSYLTYKGSKIDTTTKSREELEISIPDPDKLHTILRKIGFSPVMTLRKSRKKYILDDIKISFDQIEGLGNFIEFELEISEKDKIELAKERLFTLLKRLDIPKEKLERRSYLELLLLKMFGKIEK